MPQSSTAARLWMGPPPLPDPHEAPPPSSIAAIVQSFSKTTGTPQLAGRDDFQQLLAELLGPNDLDGGDTLALEEDVVMNYRLIQIVTSAGLTVLLQEDPFGSQEDLVLQASNSLLVIRKAIQRNPKVLFCLPPISNDLKELDQTMLFLWLLPRLLPLLGHAHAEKLVAPLLETIECIFVATTQIPEAWKYTKDLICFCRSSFTSIIGNLQSTAKLTAAMSKSFYIELPGEGFVVQNASVREQITSYPRLLKFHIRCPAQAGLVAIRIYSLLSRLVQTTNYPGLRLASDNYVWMLNGLAKFWECLSAWEALRMVTETLRTLKMHVIDALRKTLDGLTLTKINIINAGNIAIFTLRCTIKVLDQSTEKLDQAMETTLASVILTLLRIAQHLPLLSQIIIKHLYPLAVALIKQDNEWAALHQHLQLGVLAVIRTYSLDIATIDQANALLRSISGGQWVFSDPHLQKKADTLGLYSESEDVTMGDGDTERPRKRARLGSVDLTKAGTIVDVSAMISHIYQLLGNQEVTELTGLSLVASDGFKNLKESDRFLPVRDLGFLACAFAGTLTKASTRGDSNCLPYHCSVCDSNESTSTNSRTVADPTNIHELFSTLDTLVKLGDYFRCTPQTRIWGMLGLRRLLNHTDDVSLLNAEATDLGQWCLGTMDTSIRELRIATSRTLSSYVSFSHNENLRKANQLYIIKALRELSETEDSIFQETCIMAWGQMGRVLFGQELEVVLAELVQFLGHSNSFIIGVAYNEIQSLANAHKETPRRLLTPFWRNISYSVVRQLQSRPQVIQLLSELCGLEVTEFLVITQAYTLPYLVLHRKSDIIERIALANGGTTVKALCVTKGNMTAILAVLLTQDSENKEEMAIRSLQILTPEFCKVTLDELVRSSPIPLAEELIKMAGDKTEAQNAVKERIRNALRLVATLHNRKPTGASKKEKKADPLCIFFENNVLGITKQFSDTIHDVKGRSTSIEKIRCLQGITEMIKLVKGCSSTALPQICACLQSAMKYDLLRKYSFNAWAAVMCELPEEDILPLVGQTFSIILQYWEQLPDDTQTKVRDMVAGLFDRYPIQLERRVQNLPSLSPIALMAKQNDKVIAWKEKRTLRRRFLDFVSRCSNENGAVVEQALYELSTFLHQQQSYIHTTAMGEQPDIVVSQLVRSLLDACIQYKDTDSNISRLSAECLGIIGAVDPSKVDAPRASKQLIILQNFEPAEESLNFVTFLLEHRLVKAFLAATDTRSQGFLAYAMQELLKFCMFDSNVVIARRPQAGPIYKRWKEFSEVSRNILTPYLTSKYVLTGCSPAVRVAHYPIYNSEHTYRSWLQEFLFDLLTKVQGNNASAIFAICSRIIKGQDVSIPNFLLPYVTLNVVISGSDSDRDRISKELLTIIESSETPGHSIQLETLRECSEAVFFLLDYFSKWLKAKNQNNSDIRAQAARVQNRHVGVDEDEVHDIAVSRVEELLAKIPAEVMGIRSFECKSYPRALFYWEQHIRQAREIKSEEDMKPLYERLQHIYAQIDEPDSIEGISAHLKIYTIDQQIIEHRNAGRWAAAQSWYEMQLFTKPSDTELQVNLLSCLRESGQYDNLLLQADSLIKKTTSPSPRIVDIVVEASWLAEKWEYLDTFLKSNLEHTGSSFEIHLGRAFSALRDQDFEIFQNAIQAARQEVIKGLTYSSTSTLDQCHPSMLKLHALSEVETISLASKEGQFQHPQRREEFMARLQRRIELLGASARDKEYILAIRRAIFALSKNKNMEHDLAITWLATARLARKAGRVQQAFHAILQGSKLGEQSATVEHARLLWHEGQHRKAIQSLQGVIDAKILSDTSTSSTAVSASEISTTEFTKIPQNFALAKANLLLAKWLDTAGHLHPSNMTAQYQKACHTFLRWEQGFYYLGRHYNKLYEAQKSLPPAQQPQVYLDGETAKLVCQNYLRSLPWGTKYIFQTLPRFLTLWLDLGLPVELVEEHGTTQFRNVTLTERMKQLGILHEGLRTRYVDKIPAYMWYTVLPQILSRITHPHPDVAGILENIIIKVVSTHPQQAIWSLMAVIKSTQKDRSARGHRILSQLQAVAKSNRALDKKNQLNKITDMRVLINQAQKLTEQLLSLCNADLPGKPVAVSLRRDFQFNHSVAPCPLVIPIQSVLSATLPTIPDPGAIRTHQSFSHDQPTIQSFTDEADVMSSLQKPRKIKIIGSNGQRYTFLCKPKDDLRKDARLMEFASMFNRLLKKDPDAIQRRLHIRTYHVTPLNEECGLIEWVNNVRPLRDILLKQYKKRGIPLQFNEAKSTLDKACSGPGKHTIFVDILLKQYPSVLHEWFVDHFPDPASWLSSRIAYARTSAVWSMMGNVLGLGDRHGENILLDETNGDTAHVDFNCLFDKGLQFDKPEMVPFRLTHNMVDGFGVSGYEGPFRRSCEVVTRILRLNEATLMTVLEAFLYDPAVDMVGKKSKRVNDLYMVVPNTPKDVLDRIRTKIQGLFPGEAVPLSVEGQVQELIRKAVAPENLCRMYIGWMSFF